MSDAFVLFTAREAAAVSGGSVSGNGDVSILEAAVDSRVVSDGCLFVPIKGDRVDGNDFILKAFEAGASASFVSGETWRNRGMALAADSRAGGKAFIIVPDTLKALQDVAKYHVARFPGLLKIGITGSSGKTTVKELVAAAFRQERRTVMNEGNFNSDSGLPLSVLRIRPMHEVGVFEMGMNRKGEMAEIARVLKPNAVVITNIGTAHIGILGTQDAIAEEKKSACVEFSGNETLFVPENEKYRDFLSEGIRGAVVPYGQNTTKGLEGALDAGLDGTSVDWEGLRVRLSLPGRHNLMNAIAAISVASYFGVTPEGVRRGIESVSALPLRSEILKGRYVILKDCYNANPDSMEAAISFSAGVKVSGRKLLVLGSMLELGPDSVAAHRELGRIAGESGADAVFFTGEETSISAETARKTGFKGQIEHADGLESLSALCLDWLHDGDFVLLKASRGIGLERLVPVLEAK